MKYLEWLRGLPEKERKAELERNKHITRGSYVVHRDVLLGSVYYPEKVIDRRKDRIVVVGSEGYMEVLPLSYRTPLTEDVYNKLIEKIFTPGRGISNIETIFKYVTPKLHAMYGEENVDIEVSNKNKIFLKIKYPKLTITNSNGFSRDFYDTYITHEFSRVLGGLYVRPKVFRAKGTIGERRIDYYFSHISGQLGGYSRNFCWGDNPLRKIVQYEEPIPLTDIIFYLVQFNEFMKWESIEGGPYNLINDIKDFVVDPSSAYFNSGAPTDKEILEILEYIEPFHYTFISETSIKIDTVVLSNTLKRFLLAKGRTDCLGIENGKRHGIPRRFDNSDMNVDGLELQKYFFKGEEIKFSFIDCDSIELPEVSEDQLTPNPLDLNYLRIYLESKFSKHLKQHLAAKYD